MKQALKAIQKISFWVVVLALLAYSIFPIYWMVVTSFRSTATITSDSGLWPQDPTFENFLGLNRLFNYSEQYMNSLIVATSVTVITMLICTLVAYAIARRNFKGRKTLSIALLFSYMFPPLLTLIPLYVYMVKAGTSGFSPKQPKTALATFPTPDCRGRNSLGMIPKRS